ncbi:hypothetical protein RZS08_37845, partial [Arthrospira platensis SPKY1]|nr:hypothetical protein [Arthrospira platensis SPKY1]
KALMHLMHPHISGAMRLPMTSPSEALAQRLQSHVPAAREIEAAMRDLIIESQTNEDAHA